MRQFATLFLVLALGMILAVRTTTADPEKPTRSVSSAPQPAKPAPAQPDIALSLASFEHSQHTLVAGQSGVPFYVAMENRVAQTRTLLAENCSWGYEMLSFEAMDANGNVYKVQRVPRPWDKNVPSPVPLEPGETALRPIELGNGTWHGMPAMAPGKTMSIKLRAILQIKPEFPLTERGIWFGRAASNWVTFTYSRP
jgi:hypothetical protein